MMDEGLRAYQSGRDPNSWLRIAMAIVGCLGGAFVAVGGSIPTGALICFLMAVIAPSLLCGPRFWQNEDGLSWQPFVWSRVETAPWRDVSDVHIEGRHVLFTFQNRVHRLAIAPAELQSLISIDLAKRAKQARLHRSDEE